MISNDLIKIVYTLQQMNNLPEKKFIEEHKITREIENIPDCITSEFQYEKVVSELLRFTGTRSRHERYSQWGVN